VISDKTATEPDLSLITYSEKFLFDFKDQLGNQKIL